MLTIAQTTRVSTTWPEQIGELAERASRCRGHGNVNIACVRHSTCSSGSLHSRGAAPTQMRSKL